MPAFYQQTAASSTDSLTTQHLQAQGFVKGARPEPVKSPLGKEATLIGHPIGGEITIQELIRRIAALEQQTQGLLQLNPVPTAPATPSLVDDTKDGFISDGSSTGATTPSLAKEETEPAVTTTVTAPTPVEATSVSVPLKADAAVLQQAEKIMTIIERYGHNNKSGPGATWIGKAKFFPLVVDDITAGRTIRMVLPAFPFKSPNRVDKALGSLPDLGEEVALSHLNGLCEAIGDVYDKGAHVYITSDGLVYNDLLGVGDEEVWTYGEALRQMALDKDLANIRFVRLWDLLDLPHEADRPKDYYLLHAPCFRREIMARYGDSSFDVRAYLRQNEDACLTYRGYIKFLQKDLAHSHISRGKDGKQLSGKKFKEAAENVARAMIVRGRAFAAAIKAKFGDAVRLSIHPSVGKEKLPMSLIPQKSGSFGYTPWHSCIAVGIDGSFNTVHPSDVKDTHELVYRYGRPYYYREKSDLYNWGDLQVEFEHLYPTGLIIRPTAGTPSLRDVPMKKVRELSQLQSPVVCRGFADTTDEAVYQSKAYELGEVVPWTYGIMQKVKDSGRRDKMANNVVSNEAMPMHFDGIFKFVATTDEHGNEVKVQKPPKFQYFTAIATAPKGSGYTLFASCARFWQHLPPPYTLERLERATWRMDNNGFWDAKMEKLPLVVRHPATGAPCVRWHEPWPASKTKFSTCDVFMENDEQAIVQLVDSLLYDRRVCLYFTWEKGDVLVNDNFGMLHTRTGFTGDCDRELWRIHFD